MEISRNKIKQAKRLYPGKSISAIALELGLDEKELTEALKREGLKLEPGPKAATATAPTPFPRGRVKWAIMALLGVCTLLAYANSYQNVFHYDDFHSITDNFHLRKLSNIPKFFVDGQTFSNKPNVKMIRPILLTTFALNYQWTGYKPWSWVLVNILIHLFNVLFVYVFLVQLTGKQKFAVIASLFFALHPLNTETVNYVNCRSSLLVSTFMLISLYAFSRSVLEKRWTWMALATACYALGFLVKEEAIVVIALALVLDFLFLWPRRRGNLAERFFYHYLPLLVVIGIYFSYRRAVLNFTIQEIQPRELLPNLLTQTRSLVHYLNILVLPMHQNTSYENIDYTKWLAPDWVLPAVAYLALWLGLGLALWKKFPMLIFFVLGFFITQAPTTLVPLNALMNEHRQYLPTLGLGLVLASAVEMAGTRLPGLWKNLVNLCLVLIFAALSVLTVNRNRIWISDMVLWRDAIRKSPGKAQVISDLGNAYFRREPQDLVRAEQMYEWAIMADKSYFKAYHNLAIINFRRGDQIYPSDRAKAEELYRRAIGYFKRAIEWYPENPDSWNDMATTHLKLKEYAEAEKDYRQAIVIDPLNYKAYGNLAFLYANTKRWVEAEEAIKAALQIYDKDPMLFFALANIQAQMGKYDDALPTIERARAINPGDPEIEQNYKKFKALLLNLKANPPPSP